MTDWRTTGWCDVCKVTLGNGDGGDGFVCPECGFDSRKAEQERLAQEARDMEPFKRFVRAQDSRLMKVMAVPKSMLRSDGNRSKP